MYLLKSGSITRGHGATVGTGIPGIPGIPGITGMPGILEEVGDTEEHPQFFIAFPQPPHLFLHPQLFIAFPQLLHLFPHPHLDLDIPHLSHCRESLKPSSLEAPPTRTRRPSFSKPTRYRKPIAKSKAATPINTMWNLVNFITYLT
jgi:hypothetical protein